MGLFSNRLHRGLANRMAAKGIHPILALEVASANYPGKDWTPIHEPIVDAATVHRLTEQCIDRGTISLADLFVRVWGRDIEEYFDLADLEDHDPSPEEEPAAEDSELARTSPATTQEDGHAATAGDLASGAGAPALRPVRIGDVELHEILHGELLRRLEVSPLSGIDVLERVQAINLGKVMTQPNLVMLRQAAIGLCSGDEIYDQEVIGCATYLGTVGHSAARIAAGAEVVPPPHNSPRFGVDPEVDAALQAWMDASREVIESTTWPKPVRLRAARSEELHEALANLARFLARENGWGLDVALTLARAAYYGVAASLFEMDGNLSQGQAL